MLQEFTQLWYQARPRVKARLEEINIEEVNSYNKLLYIVLEEFNKVIELDNTKMDAEQFTLAIQEIDYGDYQGTRILTFARDIYQPEINETFFTYVRYGSCSGCDTLMNIIYSNQYNYDDYETLSKEEKKECDAIRAQQIEDLLTLCLHMVEKITQFKS